MPQAYGAQARTTFSGQLVDAPLHADASVSLPPLHEAGAPQAAPWFPAGRIHPTAVSHASAVHGFVSVQSMAGPLRHAPDEHVSLDVHALPSSQAEPFGAAGFEQTPVAALHVPMPWHWSRAVQTTGFVPTHLPAWQASVLVQALASSQAVPFVLGVLEHAPVEGSHTPTLHPSSCERQSTAVPGLHERVDESHVSAPLQAFPSSHAAFVVHPQGLGSVVQRPVESLHPSTVQAMPSLQTRPGPPQVPFVHVSGVVQNLPSSHAVPFALFGLEQVPVDGLQAPAVWH